MNILKQSTAATVKLGAFVDDTDGKTAETGLTISQADIRLSKNGGDFAQTNNATGATHDEFGYYDIPLDTTDTGTLGRLRVAVSESGALPVWQDFLVVTANVYDTLCSTDTFDVNVTALADDVITAGKFDESTAFPLKSADTGSTQVARVGADGDTLETLSDEIAAVKAETALIVADTGTDGVKIASAQTVATVTNLTNLPTIPANWLTAAGIATGAITSAKFASSAITSTVLASNAITDAKIATDAFSAAKFKADAVTKIQNGLATPTNITAGTITTTTNLTNLPAVTTDWLTADGVKADAVTKISVGVWTDANTFAIDEKGFWLQTLYDDLVNGGRLDLLIDSIIAHLVGIKGAGWTSNDNLKQIMYSIDSTYGLVEDGGDIDLLIDAIKAKTDQLTFTAANKVDATATTDTSSIAGDIWSYAKRTLTHPSVSAEEPEDSNTLILYRDADIAIELTDLTIPAGAKKYIFTIKDNLDSGDDQAVLQASYAIDGSEVETNTLVYINSAAAPVLTNPVTFTLTDTNITIDLTAEAAALLPRYERGYLNWDLKLVTDASVTIVLQGLAQIIGTSTRAIE